MSRPAISRRAMKKTSLSLLLYLGMLTLILAACQSALATSAGGPAAAQKPAVNSPVLNDLNSVEELRERFIQDAGKTRLVLLLSPT